MSGYEAARLRALSYRECLSGTICRADEIFSALTGLINIRQYPLTSRLAGGYGFCYFCKTQGGDGFRAVCNRIPCSLAFNRWDQWRRSVYLDILFPVAQRLFLLDLSSLPSTEEIYGNLYTTENHRISAA